MRFVALHRTAGSIMFGACLLTVPHLLSAWTGPASAPPNSNVSAPVNLGSSDQVKNAGLSLNSLAVFGNTILSGTTNYLNFGTTAGITGYGIRNNSGTIEFKNSGGNWENRNTLTGNLTVAGSVYALGYYHTSDARLKKNIQTLDGLDIVERLRGVSFEWKHDNTSSAGLVAQEVEKVLPSAVRTDRQGTKSVDYDQVIGALVEAIKEQQRQIDVLSHELEARVQ